MTQTIDETKLEQLMGQMVGHMTGAALCFGVWLGDELGLYRALTELGHARPPTSSRTRPAATAGSCASGSTARSRAGCSTWDRDDRPLRAHARSDAWRSPTTSRRCSWPAR